MMEDSASLIIFLVFLFAQVMTIIMSARNRKKKGAVRPGQTRMPQVRFEPLPDDGPVGSMSVAAKDASAPEQAVKAAVSKVEEHENPVREKIDVRKLIIYSEIMKPKFDENF